LKCAVVTTTSPDIASTLDGVIQQLKQRLGARPDLLVAYFTSHHSQEAESLHRQLLEQLQPRVLLGCPARGVLGDHVEVEAGAGLTLWAASWPDVELTSFHLSVGEGDVPELSGWPASVPDGAGFVLLADPYTTSPDALLQGIHERFAGAPVVGGMASGSTGPGSANLFTESGMYDEGVVGVAISGSVKLDTVVSQGCRPIGTHFVVTAVDRNAILTLGGKPALDVLHELASGLDPADVDLLQRGGLHVGRVVDERKSHFEQGDFLVRNMLGVDPDKKSLLIGDYLRPGQTVQFMLRDAAAASQELQLLLSREADKPTPLGALLFSCAGRGSHMFDEPHHDIRGVHTGVGDIPTAGFFAAGEIGPVGGQPFLHGLTASIGLFRKNVS
jgi:small ligand-binding sensory domain FIST